MDESSPAPLPGEPPPVPPPPPVELLKTPTRPRFVGPLFRWLFLFSIPASMAAGMLTVYTHEFAHGLSALATGGYFLGIRSGGHRDPSNVFAFADAWSWGHESVVFAAGIAVNVILGGLVLWRALRCRNLVPRILLLILAGAFLSDFHYALQGCVAEKGEPFDTTTLLALSPSPALRWSCLVVSLLGTIAGTIAVSWGLFRCWEQVFGALSGGRAFWVIVLLANPAPIFGSRSAGGQWLWGISAALFFGILAGLIRIRLRHAEPAPIRFRRWGLAMVGAFVLSCASYAVLRRGIQVGTYPALSVRDIDSEHREVAGVLVHSGLSTAFGGPRPTLRTEIFVAGQDRAWTVGIFHSSVLDVVWLSRQNRLIAVCPDGLLRAVPALDRTERLWTPERGRITRADHGPGGEIVAVLEESGLDGTTARQAIYLYDPARAAGELHETGGGVGHPFFTPDVPGRAWLTVDGELWEIVWSADAPAPKILKHSDQAPGMWTSGVSGEKRWLHDGLGWTCDKARVPAEGVSLWRIGPEGFYAVRDTGAWELTRPDGITPAKGTLTLYEVVGVQIHQGVAWVALDNGDLRPIDAGSPSFRVTLPR